jgi:hypothetical protein
VSGSRLLFVVAAADPWRDDERPAELEASAYFIVAEALARSSSPRAPRTRRWGVRRGQERCASRFATTGSAAPILTVTGSWGPATE